MTNCDFPGNSWRFLVVKKKSDPPGKDFMEIMIGSVGFFETRNVSMLRVFRKQTKPKNHRKWGKSS